MINNCPHCHIKLTFSKAQRVQLQQALKSLAAGKRLTIKCPGCKKSIKLDAPAGPKITTTKKKTTVPLPPPPDLAWLKTGQLNDEEKVKDVPMALVLHPDSATRNTVKAAMESVGYRVITADSVQTAIEQMLFINFACIAFHVDFEMGGLEKSMFHAYMRQMPMERRRYIFYILMGPQFHSLYGLEALAYSANLVVAEQDIQHFDIILRKAIPAYEKLFGPILEELNAYGKR